MTGPAGLMLPHRQQAETLAISGIPQPPSDVAAKARAYGTLVGAGMTEADAARRWGQLSGFVSN